MIQATLECPADRRGAMTWLVEELLHQAGHERRVDVVTTDTLRVLHDGRQVLAAAELERLFAVLSLSVEQDAPRDGFGRVDETADLHPAGTPWITARARELFPGGADPQPLTVYLTHDVDRTTGRELTSLVKAIRGTLRGDTGEWLGLSAALDSGLMGRRLQELLDLEVQAGVRGTYFMIAGPAGLGRYDSRTDIRWPSARNAAAAILKAGGFIGLHGSFHAAERDLYTPEAERIRGVTGTSVRLHRNHYLRLDTKRYCTQLAQAGLGVDFTLGYSRRTGYRNGVCVPFLPWNLAEGRPGRLTAVPLVYMEQAGQQRDPEPALRDLETRLAAAAPLGGAVSLLIHPEVFAVDRRWYDVYESIIGVCRSLGARLDGNPEELAPAESGNHGN
jgi:peptidoglycan/xylan/chitin deacetylase (PgdA/CDA1 family)